MWETRLNEVLLSRQSSTVHCGGFFSVGGSAGFGVFGLRGFGVGLGCLGVGGLGRFGDQFGPDWAPVGSVRFTGSPRTYAYRFVSPPSNPIGSFAVHRPVSAS